MASHIDTGSMHAPANYKSYTLDHLGLVAGLYDEFGIGERIDQLIPQDHEQRHISIGTAVKAMILNGLGFASRALYLTPHFFQDKPVERLLGKGICAEHLNEYTLGRTLDSLYDYGVTPLYSQLAIPVVKQLGLDHQSGHIDSTSFHYDGRGNSDRPPEDPKTVHITRGYSRDHRPDLNQVSLQLITDGQAGIPTLMRPLNGNSVDSRTFNETINNHLDQFEEELEPVYIVGDAALYTQNNLQALDKNYYFITRVPESLKSAREVLDLFAEELSQEGKKRATTCVESHYAGVQQRWLIIYSKANEERGRETVQKQMLKLTKRDHKAFGVLCREAFACEADAQKALQAFGKKLKATKVMEGEVVSVPYYNTSGRPKKNQEPDGFKYYIKGQLASLPDEYRTRVMRKSCFILATNQMYQEELSDTQLIKRYKNQQNVERGFRFLKDPLFHASTLYLKSPKRIMALMMIMTLCLLVYAALEYRIRCALREANETFPNQKGKRVAKPTARWVFQFFTGIHVLLIHEVMWTVLNLNEYHRLLLHLLGETYGNFYFDG